MSSNNAPGGNPTIARTIFTVELAIAAALVFGSWHFAFHGRFDELWGAAMFCFSVVLAIIIDNFIAPYVLHRKPLFSRIVAIVLSVILLATGAGFCWTMAH